MHLLGPTGISAINTEPVPLGNDDGNANENVTQKVNLSCFKRHPSYSISFNLSSVGEFS